MKKTITIHIKSFPFIIEEVAYNRLENYINRLKDVLQNEESADEIVEDIELRIAELLNQKTSASKQVIDDQDVQSVLETLGDPSDYASDDVGDESKKSKANEYADEKSEKRLYRDVDEAYIGGVCAGLANYFNIDATVIRLVWLLIFIAGGAGLILYIILWIVIPSANTSIEKLKMKGKPINLDTVKGEFERATSHVSEKSRHFAQQIKKQDHLRNVVHGVGSVIRKLFGLSLLFIGFTILITFMVYLFGNTQMIPIASEEGFINMSALSELVFNTQADYNLAWLAVYCLLIPLVVFLILAGFATLFKLRNRWYRFFNMLLLTLFIVGICIGVIVATRTSSYYSVSGEIQKEILKVNSNQLVILPASKDSVKKGEFTVNYANQNRLFIGENTITNSGIDIIYHDSKDSLYRVVVEKEAFGQNLKKAVDRASHIEFSTQIVHDTLFVPTNFQFPRKDKLRGQEIELHIYLPKGKSVSVVGNDVNMNTNDDDDDFEWRNYGYLNKEGVYYQYD